MTQRKPRWRRVGVVSLSMALIGALLLPAAPRALGADEPYGFQGETGSAEDVDARTGSVAPTTRQLAIVKNMGATARWNDYGTPHSLIKHGGYLASGLSSDAIEAARSWVDTNRELFRLSQRGVDNLEVINDSKLDGTGAHVVLFRQRFGALDAAQDGMLTIGVVGGKIAYVSSSIAGDGNAPAAAELTATEAYMVASSDAGLGVEAADVGVLNKKQDGWTLLEVKGLEGLQRSKLIALPTPESGIRPAYETIVLDNQVGEGNHPIAFTYFVDAIDGKVWFRHNRVQHLAQPETGMFTGETGGPGNPCGPKHPFEAPAGTQSIDVAATADNPADDIVINLYDPTGKVVASTDTLSSPEAIHYSPAVVVPGIYAAEVCQFDPQQEAFAYSGLYSANPAGTSGLPYPPKWRVFPANPPLDYSTTDTRELWCWESAVEGTPVEGCEREVKNIAARAPWDYSFRTGAPTFSTIGNAAFNGEAWLAANTVIAGAIGPGPTGYRPVSLERNYDFEWTNQWNESKCNPSVFTSGQRNDVDAATTNLFAMHNRMHDWSYFLGFTEQNYNLQDSNLGNGAAGPFPLGREADPEIGNVQAGAISGGYPTFGGRDNANQITLNDGIAPITNMYLWQSIAGAFYAECTDGDYDMSVIGHEYTHAISNRMVGGPDAGLSGPQAGAMGESWSDLSAVEYLNEYGFAPTGDENPFAVGPYVTGDHQAGIRNYGMNFSPLNYSDVGYDVTGPQVHADGEIWSAINFDVRQALIDKYNGAFPATDATLQQRCGDGELPADQCPGNRRWIQIMFDAWLLMPPTVSMVDARDAYLAADLMRFGGANQDVLWREFARGGLGTDAASDTNADPDPTPSFESPLANNATLTFAPIAIDERRAPVDAEVFVGDHEQRATPIADTDSGSDLGNSASFVPGTYDLIVRADGYGAQRVTVTVGAGQSRTLTVRMPTNWASVNKGANAYGDGVNLESLIDDTEETNWASLGEPVEGRTVFVDMTKGEHLVNRVQVSAMLRASDPENEGDPGSQNRFSALRQFEILTCNATEENCSRTDNFGVIFTSATDAFPAHAPRPRSPELIIRSFDVPDTRATHVALRVLTNQCTGGPAFQGDTDNDPLNNPDCDEGDAGPLLPLQGNNVRAAELQVFSR